MKRFVNADIVVGALNCEFIVENIFSEVIINKSGRGFKFMRKRILAILLTVPLVVNISSCNFGFQSDESNFEETNGKITDDEANSETVDVKEEYNPVTHMRYTLNDDGKSYTVRPEGFPDVIKELVIPGEYKGLPVTEVRGGMGESSIETIVISEGIEKILIDLDYCTDIKNIYLPASVIYIRKGTFNCRATMGGHGHRKSNVIEKIVVAEGNPCYYVDGNCLIEKASKKIILGCNSSVIPTDGSVKSIGYAAFANCHSIETVILPKSIIELEDSAFDTCHNLKRVYITSSVSKDKKIVNINVEPIFGYDIPKCTFYVPDAESLEIYSKFFGPVHIEIGTP